MEIAGMILVLLLCVLIAVVVYVLLVRPFIGPLEKRIPTGRQYRAGVTPKKRPA